MSSLRATLEFLDTLGLYDVVLPFILVFTLVFAILERSKILGQEPDGSPKKNINAMVAFVSAFFVIASTRLVALINMVVAQTMLLLVFAILFLLLISSYKEKKFWLEGGWNTLFTIIMFLGVVLIFLYNLGWLDDIWAFLSESYSSTIGSSVLMLIILIGLVLIIVHEPKPAQAKEKKET